MPDPPQPNPPRKLTRIGSYRLLEPLGSGGMSSVFRAEHTESGHEVALKILPRTLAKNATMLQRFLQEARSAESLEHPGIVAIYDRGVEDGRYYLVLEYIAGGDLHDRVRERGGLPVADALGMVKGVAEALQYAAKRGVIHRDIKPANILLTLDGKVKVADLGLALQIEEEDERVTRDGTTVGTVDYMAPEQARDSRATSVRSDIYSLGCTFFQLLAGSAPYAGGDVVEKLRRHAFEPPRDIRHVRTDVPDAVADLILKMCAKRPEQRFQDYDELLAAIGKIDPAALPSTPLMAIIDDDDGDSGDLPTIYPAGAKVPGGTTEHVPLMALIDDDDDGNNDGLDPPRTGPTQAFQTRPKSEAAEPEYGLVDLDSEAPPPSPSRPQPKPQPKPTRTESKKPGPSGLPGAPGVDLSELADIEDASAAPARPAGRRRPAAVTSRNPAIDDSGIAPAPSAGFERGGIGDEGDLKDWIVRGLLAGIAIVLVGFGIQQVISLQLSGSGSGSTQSAETAEENPEGGPGDQSVSSTGPAAPSVTVASGYQKPWVEPADPPAAEPPPEPSFPGVADESAFLPDWARTDPAIDGTTVVVRRLDPSTNRDHAATLGKALDVPGGTTEFADLGPFFERDLKLGNRPRRIRARAGTRSIVVLQPPTANADSRTRSAIIPLESDLVLEGLDLVVPINDLPLNQTALFDLRGGTLLLRDCTITIDGPSDRPFRIARLGGASASGPPRLRIERCIIRGPNCTPLHFDGDSGEALIARSVLLCGSGPAVLASASNVAAGPPPSRRVNWLRSVVATRSAVLDAEPGSSGPAVLKSQALGTTFARISGGNPDTGLLSSRSSLDSANARDFVDWSGDHNVYNGWPGWLTTSAASPSAAVIANLDAARRVWSGADAQSREQPDPWPESVGEAWNTAEDLAGLAPEALPTLARVARPTPFLRERTVGAFERLSVPLAATATDMAVIFDANAAPWNGDLGRFLADRPAPGNRRWVLRVRGHGAKPLSPIHIPDGTSLEIDVEPDPNGGEPLVWTPTGTHNAPLIAAKGADVTLYNVRVRVPAASRFENLIRVENGRLQVLYSQLLAPDAASLSGPLIILRAATTQPLPALLVGLPGADLPVAQFRDSVLISGREAVRAELGHGVVALVNCAVAGGGSAIELMPQNVSRSRFQADLWLDRCTLVAEREAVRFGAWQGSSPGPDRPWLVSSRGSAFLDGFDRSGREPRGAIVLRADADSVARGALDWQASGDVYELASFIALGSDPPVFSPRPDVRSGWVDFWGDERIVRAVGPSRDNPGQPRAVHLRHAPLRPGHVQPDDLTLESSRPSGKAGAVIGAAPALPEPRVLVAPPPISVPVAVPAPPRPKPSAATPGNPSQSPASQPASVKSNRPF